MPATILDALRASFGVGFLITILDALRASFGVGFLITILDALRASLGVGTCLLQFLMLYEHRLGWGFPNYNS